MKKNYRLLIVGILVMMPGFVIIVLAQIMHSFGVLALIIGPSIVMIDFLIAFFAITYVGR